MKTDIYVLIIEHKDEAPLIMEQHIMTSNYVDVCKRMENMRKDPNIIRVAIGRVEFASGNKSLFAVDNTLEAF